MSIIFPIIVLIILISMIYLYIQNRFIQVEYININTKLSFEPNNLSILLITDTHFPRQNVNIKRLLSHIKNINPNIIMLGGDIINCGRKIPCKKTEAFIRQITQISDVYAVLGNHEHSNAELNKYLSILIKYNVSVMENSVSIIKYGNKSIEIIGLKCWRNFNKNYSMCHTSKNADLRLILTHMSPPIDDIKKLDKKTIIMAGHEHGGQIILPFMGGVISPDLGFFPKYYNGLYELSDKINLVMSRGIGKSRFPWRINNRPHLPVIILGTLVN